MLRQASHELTLATRGRGLYEFTDEVAAWLARQKFSEGLLSLHLRHTSASLLIQENADPDVPRDMLAALDQAVPLSANYRHAEGNSAAHVKSSLVGASEMVIIENGHLILGTWQSIFFCEFDGPRMRKVIIKLMKKN